MSAPAHPLPARADRYAAGLRRIAASLARALDRLGRAAARDAPPVPMPRHTSFDEIVGDLRNRIQSDPGGGQRPFY